MTTLPLAKTKEQRTLWEKLQPVNRVATTDTYKRTMAASGSLFADNFSCYTLAARKPLPEAGAEGRYIMAGLEKILYPWFMNPISQEEVNQAKEFFTRHSQIKAFSEEAWNAVVENNGYLPVDVYSLPGGQTFLVKDGE